MNVKLSTGSAVGARIDLLVIPLFQKEIPAVLKDQRLRFFRDLLKEEGISGKTDEVLAVRTLGRLRVKRLAVVGMGERSACSEDTLRLMAARALKLAREVKAQEIGLVWPELEPGSSTTTSTSQALAEGARLAAYRFNVYKKKDVKNGATREPKQLTIFMDDSALVKESERGLSAAKLLAEATCFARDLVNTPSADLTPQHLADLASALVVDGSRITAKVMDADKLDELGMHATLAMGRGSDHAPVGVHLTYHPLGEPQKRIVIVGKAVTFDSGGLSLKQKDGMATMKMDMAGAATVLGLFKLLPKLALPFEIHGIFLAVENMPSGKACRPGDIVTSHNGTTIEILSTDAEGRVTLADALSYASQLKPDLVIDLATLTGACLIALGEDIAGLLGNDAELIDALTAAAQATGEPVWELPLYQPYAEAVKSKIADLKITAGRSGGVITAALFLEKFVGKDLPWAHLDIAGPAYAEKETRADQPAGGTGFGVRLLARYLQALSK